MHHLGLKCNFYPLFKYVFKYANSCISLLRVQISCHLIMKAILYILIVHQPVCNSEQNKVLLMLQPRSYGFSPYSSHFFRKVILACQRELGSIAGSQGGKHVWLSSREHRVPNRFPVFAIPCSKPCISFLNLLPSSRSLLAASLSPW